MVVDAYTVVDPWAVVVKSLNTMVANCTVSGPWSPNNLTIWAQISRVDILEQTDVGKVLLISLDHTRVSHCGQNKE